MVGILYILRLLSLVIMGIIYQEISQQAAIHHINGINSHQYAEVMKKIIEWVDL